MRPFDLYWSHTATTWRLRLRRKTVAVVIPRRDAWVAIGYEGHEALWLGTHPERDTALAVANAWGRELALQRS